MVGSWEDAEDIVQDTFTKWLTLDQQKIQNTKAYLVKSVTHNCINHLNAFKKRNIRYLSTFKAGELIEKYKELDFAKFDLESEVAAALAMIHKKLEPLEKGIYLLREIFNVDYEDLQELFGKKKENCRQLFCRAKEKLKQETSKSKTEVSQPFRLLEHFRNACTLGHLSDFMHQLVQEARQDIHQ